MEENKNALDHVKKLIEDLNSDLLSKIEVDDKFNYDFDSLSYIIKVSMANKIHKIKFERSIIDDLEVALEKYKDTKYLHTLESSIKFTIYLNIGREGLLKGFDISKKLINDRRDWIKDYRINTSFSPKMTEVFYQGLQGLLGFFNSQIEKHKLLGLDYSEIADNKKWVQLLINYYKEHKHLNSTEVGIKNLQFLKAAAIKRIMDLEEKRKSERMPTTLRALDQKIYHIVAELRNDPFLDIEPPDFMHDIAAAQ